MYINKFDIWSWIPLSSSSDVLSRQASSKYCSWPHLLLPCWNGVRSWAMWRKQLCKSKWCWRKPQIFHGKSEVLPGQLTPTMPGFPTKEISPSSAINADYEAQHCRFELGRLFRPLFQGQKHMGLGGQPGPLDSQWNFQMTNSTPKIKGGRGPSFFLGRLHIPYFFRRFFEP